MTDETTTVVLFQASRWRDIENDVPDRLAEVIEWLQGILDKAPPEHAAAVEFKLENDWDGGCDLTISYERPATWDWSHPPPALWPEEDCDYMVRQIGIDQ